MTTSGFLPPSSSVGDTRWRPQTSAMRRPTSTDPVNPTLCTSPASSACSSPAKVSGPSDSTSWNAPVGMPDACTIRVTASAMAGVYSAGFHTTALPASSAGTRYQDGTATGKFPAVITAMTPTGVRNVNSCLSDISLGTVCPYSRRPSEAKNVQVSMASWTSPRDSVMGLPISRVTSWLSASLLARNSSPIAWIASPRIGAGTRAHSACAARARRAAVAMASAPASSTVATTSSRWAGLGISTVRDVAPVQG